MYSKYNLKIGSLNIGGNAKVKCQSADIADIIKQHDIFAILESWLDTNDSCPTIDGYVNFRSDRKKKRKAKRNSGGIIIYCRSNIVKGLSKIASSSNDILWLKFDSLFFGFPNDLYLCVSYLVPESSPYAQGVDILQNLTDEVDHYAAMGSVAIIGDLNSRIGAKQENHYRINTNGHNFDISQPDSVPIRLSCDTKMNSRGQKLMELLTNHDLLLANGRVCGDLNGKYTCCQKMGMSVVDMLIIPSDFINRLNYFTVADFDWYSDHAYISACFSVDINKCQSVPATWSKLVRQFQNWNSESKQKFSEEIKSQAISNRLSNFCNTQFADSTLCVTNFVDIITDVLHSVFPKKPKRLKHIKRPAHYNQECQLAKRLFKRSKRLFNRDCNNMNRRHQYLRDKRRYKKAVYKAKLIFQETKLNRLANLEHSDPKTFWRELKHIIKPVDNSIDSIEPQTWYRHFQSLLDPSLPNNIDQQHLQYVKTCLPVLERSAIDNEIINVPINDNELRESVKLLKTGKSIYLDEISNEAIKCGINVLEAPILHLFNNVLEHSNFPQCWGDGLIKPLHKKNDKLCVDNYRGIIISSCIGKLFTKILTRRIDKYMRVNDLWKLNQCGFKADHRTEDNVFVLNTIYEKYVIHQNKKIYVAFIDFSKFFDKINRELMFYKLLKYNITGKVYNLIKSMYSNTMYQIVAQGYISPKLPATLGVKQGCCMSPVLSNIFQNDLHEIFSNCDPIVLGDIKINSISWADDLIMMSTSKQGLQKCLDSF